MPEKLGDLYRAAQVDLAAGRPQDVLKWAFWHAKTVSRVAAAERWMKTLEARESYVAIDAYHAPSDAARDMVMARMPDKANAQRELCEALEMESATAAVHDLLKARTMNVKVEPAPKMRVIDGGQK